MDLPAIRWIVSPQAKSKDHASLPKILCALHDDSGGEVVSKLYDAESDGESSRASSLRSETTLPASAFDDYFDARTDQNDSISEHFTQLNLQVTPTDGISSVPSDDVLSPDSQTFHDYSQSYRLANQRSFSHHMILIRLLYVNHSPVGDQVPRIVKMDVTHHFQVLLGCVAQSLSIGPELVGFTIGVNSKEIKLSPIASPRDLGFSGDLTINVWVNRKQEPSHRSRPSLSSRISGTDWVRSFPPRVYKCGLPRNPSQSKEITPSPPDQSLLL